jgi:hypothetical protein
VFAFGILSYYQLVMLFLNLVCLTVALAYPSHGKCFLTRFLQNQSLKAIGIWRWLSKAVENGQRSPALRLGHP